MKYDYSKFEEQLEVLLAQEKIEGWQGFGIGHYRINGYLDIWPRRKKWFSLEDHNHGEYVNLESFLERH